MEPIGQVLADMNPLKRSETESAGRPSHGLRQNREKAIAALILKMYESCRKETPDPEGMETEVRLAMADLEEIPDYALSGAFLEAQVQAGGFIPSNGLIVRSWRSQAAKAGEDAQRAIRLENTRRYLLAKPYDLPTAEQREEIAKDMAAIARKLKS